MKEFVYKSTTLPKDVKKDETGQPILNEQGQMTILSYMSYKDLLLYIVNRRPVGGLTRTEAKKRLLIRRKIEQSSDKILLTDEEHSYLMSIVNNSRYPLLEDQFFQFLDDLENAPDTQPASTTTP